METAQVFVRKNRQVIRLPKSCRIRGDELYANKIGNILILTPKNEKWGGLLSSLPLFTDDFFSDGRAKDIDVERESL